MLWLDNVIEHSFNRDHELYKPYLFIIRTTGKLEYIINKLICVGIIEYHRNYRSVDGKYSDYGYESCT